MLAIERQRRILELAKKQGAVKTHELSTLLKVTEETIRRDLDTLARQGFLHRSHGGATDVSLLIRELPQSDREDRQAAEKTAIAKLAVKYVEPNETIMVDAGSTSLEFVRHLPEGYNLRIVTYGRDVIERLSIRNDVQLVLLGGIYEPKARRFEGLLTDVGIRTLRIDRFFFSGSAYNTNQGVGEPNPEEARIKMSILANTKWRCAMIDHTKLGRASEHYFIRPSEIDVLISDSAATRFFGLPRTKEQAIVILKQ